MGSILGEKIAETPTVDIEAAPPCGANSDEKNDQKNHDHSGRADSELARSEGRSGPYFEPRKEKGSWKCEDFGKDLKRLDSREERLGIPKFEGAGENEEGPEQHFG